jgi:succinate-acetate transporter protein
MEFASGNTFGTCAFTGFGAFWCSWATFFIPWFGTAQAYADHPSMFLDAIGLWCFMWS